MDFVYICSRYRSDEEYSIEFNMATAAAVCRAVVKESNNEVLPVAPHLYLPQFLDDGIPEERQAACQIGIKLLPKCNSMKVIVIDGIISEGMLKEIYAAQNMDIPIDHFFYTKEEMETIINEMLAINNEEQAGE